VLITLVQTFDYTGIIIYLCMDYGLTELITKSLFFFTNLSQTSLVQLQVNMPIRIARTTIFPKPVFPKFCLFEIQFRWELISGVDIFPKTVYPNSYFPNDYYMYAKSLNFESITN